MLLYCLKCRKNTVSEKPKVVQTKNRGIMLLWKCVVWDCRKLKFIKEQAARGLLHFLGIKTPLNLYRMGFPGLLTDGGGGWQKDPRSLKSVTKYPTTMTLGTGMPYLRKIQKIYESGDAPLEFRWHQPFFTRNRQILLYQEIHI